MSESGNDKKIEHKQEILLLIGITLILVILATASLLLYPQSQIKKCASIILLPNKYSCYYSLAISTHNSSICNYLQGSYSAQCYASLGEKLNNATLCRKALGIDPAYGSACIMNISYAIGNYSLCSAINGSNLYECATRIGIKEMSATPCSLIKNNTENMACTSSINFIAALQKNTPSLCYYVSTNNSSAFLDMLLPNVKNITENILGKKYTILEYLATEYRPTPAAQDLCYLSSAIALNSASACSEISNPTIKSVCISSLTSPSVTAENYTAAINACSSTGNFKNACINAVLLDEAIQTKNITICSRFNESLSVACYASIASYYKDTYYCGFINNATENAACIASVQYNSST